MQTRDLTNINSLVPTNTLADLPIIDVAFAKNTLTSSASTRTFNISCKDDEILIEVILLNTAATYTFLPAGSLAVSDGTPSANNIVSLAGASGDKYIICIKRINGTNYVVSRNFQH